MGYESFATFHPTFLYELIWNLALAAFLVFCWHFLHWSDGYPIPFEGAPAFFPAAILDEGHCGVALFMTLSGYLFAKLLDGRRSNYGAFLWNRLIRLGPLFAAMLVTMWVFQTLTDAPPPGYMAMILTGFILPHWPNGGWSIAVELHFYLILPVLLLLMKRSPWLVLAVIGAAILIRLGIYEQRGEVKSLAYFTILGRIDQFVLGIVAFKFGAILKGRHFSIVAVMTAFLAFYWWFDLAGGAQLLDHSRLWVIVPTIEGTAFAALIAYYDRSFSPSQRGVSGLVARLGGYSYSIYLFHFFVVFREARLIDTYVVSLSNIYLAITASLVCFVAMLPFGYLSYRFIEGPALAWRKAYLTDRGFAICSDAMQICGGAGFTEHLPVSQYLRDSRIALIYEGANGVQALDLVGRKLAADGGRAVMTFFAEIDAFVDAQAADEALTPFTEALAAAKAQLQEGTMWLMQNGLANPDNAGAASTDYLHLFALTGLTYMWTLMAKAANGRIAGGDGDAFFANKLIAGRYFIERVLPDAAARLAKLTSGSATLMAYPAAAF